MKKFLCIVSLLVSGVVYGDVGVTDVISAANVVSVKLGVPISVVVLQRQDADPLAAAWRPLTQSCHIYVSAKNAKYLDLLIGKQPMIPMLEGFLAHELAHCVEMRARSATMGMASMALYNSNMDVRVKAETVADIVSIMYWKQEYPKDGDSYANTMISWRRANFGTDISHASHVTLEKALPLIPALVDVFKAMDIRASLEDR